MPLSSFFCLYSGTTKGCSGSWEANRNRIVKKACSKLAAIRRASQSLLLDCPLLSASCLRTVLMSSGSGDDAPDTTYIHPRIRVSIGQARSAITGTLVPFRFLFQTLVLTKLDGCAETAPNSSPYRRSSSCCARSAWACPASSVYWRSPFRGSFSLERRARAPQRRAPPRLRIGRRCRERCRGRDQCSSIGNANRPQTWGARARR